MKLSNRSKNQTAGKSKGILTDMKLSFLMVFDDCSLMTDILLCTFRMVILDKHSLTAK